MSDDNLFNTSIYYIDYVKIIYSLLSSLHSFNNIQPLVNKAITRMNDCNTRYNIYILMKSLINISQMETIQYVLTCGK